MAAVLARRALVTAAVVGITIMAAPVLDLAFADDAPKPDFATSSFQVSGTDVSFPTVFARPGGAVQPPSTVSVEFTTAIKLSRQDNSLVVPQTDSAAPSYLVNQANPDTQIPVHATAVDANDDDRLIVTPPDGLPDATYTLHVTVFAQDACPDIPVGTIGTPPDCTMYDDFVNDPVNFTPFAFTTDGAAPAVHVGNVNGGHTPIDANHVKTVAVAGTAAADTASVALTIKSGAGGSPRFATATVTPPDASGQPATWSATVDLSKLTDGTLTITAVATDEAGNKTDPGSTASIAMAAHPSAPRSFTARPGDASAPLTWWAPLTTGGHPVTGYVVTATDITAGTAATSVALQCSNGTCPTAFTARHLVNGHDFRLTVAASTDVGAGAKATTTVRPLAGSTLTAATSAARVAAGRKVTLHGRLTMTASHAGIKGVKVTITPHFADGRTGSPFTVTTDPFGVWAKTFRPARTATYVVRWAGSSTVLPAAARVHVRVI